MVCSPSRLLIDVSLWKTEFSYAIEKTYLNLSQGDPYDCFLTSVPCRSNATETLLPFLDTLTFWMDLGVFYSALTLTVCLGIVANVLNIAIFSTHQIGSESTNKLLIFLSVSDLTTLLLYLAMLCCFLLCWTDASLALVVFTTITSKCRMAIQIVSSLSMDTVTVLAISRAVSVTYPLHFQTIFSKRNTNVILACLGIVFLCSLGTKVIPGQAGEVFHPFYNRTIHLRIRAMAVVTQIPRTVIFIKETVSVTVHLFAVFFTLVQLRSHMKSRAELSTTSRPGLTPRELRLTKMTLVVCLISILLFSITASLKILLMMLKTNTQVPELAFNCVSLLITAMAASFNFIVYFNMYPGFKKGLRLLWCCVYRDKKQAQESQ